MSDSPGSYPAILTRTIPAGKRPMRIVADAGEGRRVSDWWPDDVGFQMSDHHDMVRLLAAKQGWPVTGWHGAPTSRGYAWVHVP